MWRSETKNSDDPASDSTRTACPKKSRFAECQKICWIFWFFFRPDIYCLVVVLCTELFAGIVRAKRTELFHHNVVFSWKFAEFFSKFAEFSKFSANFRKSMPGGCILTRWTARDVRLPLPCCVPRSRMFRSLGEWIIWEFHEICWKNSVKFQQISWNFQKISKISKIPW